MFQGLSKRHPLALNPVIVSTLVSTSLGCKWVEVSNIGNTFAYYDRTKFTALKSFIVQTPRVYYFKAYLHVCPISH
jgi:hypothetical protein